MVCLSGPGQAKAFGQHFTISSSDKTLFYADEKEAIVGTGKLRVTGTFGHLTRHKFEGDFACNLFRYESI